MKPKRLTPLAALLAFIVRAWIVVILAVIVVLLAYYVIWKIARILSQIKPQGSSTNTTEYYYTTNSGGMVSYHPAGSVQIAPAFSLFYCVPSLSNQLPWLAVSNCTVTAGGQSVDLINNSNEYMESVDLGTYAMVYDWDAQSGLLLGSWLNGLCSVVIQKSVNLAYWFPVYTNAGCVPDAVNQWTDGNAIQRKAFYRIERQ